MTKSRICCHCKIHQKSYQKKRRLGSNLTPGGRLRVNRRYTIHAILVPYYNVEINKRRLLKNTVVSEILG